MTNDGLVAWLPYLYARHVDRLCTEQRNDERRSVEKLAPMLCRRLRYFKIDKMSNNSLLPVVFTWIWIVGMILDHILDALIHYYSPVELTHISDKGFRNTFSILCHFERRFLQKNTAVSTDRENFLLCVVWVASSRADWHTLPLYRWIWSNVVSRWFFSFNFNFTNKIGKVFIGVSQLWCHHFSISYLG